MASANGTTPGKRLKQARLPFNFKTRENKPESEAKAEESPPVKKNGVSSKLARFAARPLPPAETDADISSQEKQHSVSDKDSSSKSTVDLVCLSNDSNSVSICETSAEISAKKTPTKSKDAAPMNLQETELDTNKTAQIELLNQEKFQDTSALERVVDSESDECNSNGSDNPDVSLASVIADTLTSKVIGNQQDSEAEDDSGEKPSGDDATDKTPKSQKQPKPPKMTPKMLEKEAERKRKQDEKQQEKEEKLREKEEKERIKAEAKAQKELTRKLKQEALDAKAASKKKAEEEKELEKKLRAEEKQKADEEKKRQEDEERKKKERVSQAFASFFTPKAKKTRPAPISSALATKLAFEPFQVKAGMRLAPIVRTTFTDKHKEAMKTLLKDQSSASLTYLQQLKNSQYVKGQSGPTWPLSKEADEVEVLDEEDDLAEVNKPNVVEESHTSCQKMRAKLLKFHENRRPSYWGTWTKKPLHISARRPFAKEDVFDYEVDSDDEWEEEEPGESVSDSEGEEKEPEDDYEVDNEFFVPHGYLSDEEAKDDSDEVMSPERMKASLKAKEVEFEEERKKKTCHLKPRLIGCIWMDQVEQNPGLQQLLKILTPYQAVACVPVPISLSKAINQKSDDGENEEKKSEPKKAKKRAFSDDDLPDLVRLFHRNIKSKKFLIKEFRAFLTKKRQDQDGNEASTELEKDLDDGKMRYTGPSTNAIETKAVEIAEWTHCSALNRTCWLVKAEILQSCGLTEQPVENTWQYLLPVKDKAKTPTGGPVSGNKEKDDVKSEEAKNKNTKAKVSLIKQFMQSPASTSEKSVSGTSENKPKKRIQLIPLAPVNKKPKLDSDTELVTLD